MVRIETGKMQIEISAAYYELAGSLAELPRFVKGQLWVGSYTTDFCLPIQQVNTAGIHRICPLLNLHDAKTRAALNEKLLSSLLHGLESGGILKGYFFDRPGSVVFPDGHVSFLRGGELLGACHRPYLIAPEFRDIRLREYPHPEAMSRLLSLLPQAPRQILLLFAFVLLASIRSLLVGAGIEFQAVAYIVGKQGLFKAISTKLRSGMHRKQSKKIITS